jgi:Outer membrane protein beta-barrel domain
MKRLLFTALFWAAATLVFAQTINKDSVKMAKDSVKQARKKSKSFNFNLTVGDGPGVNKNDTTPAKHHKNITYPKFSLGITIARLDLGLATLVDNGSFTLSKNNSFLSYQSWKTSNAAFDVFQMGARFSDNFRIYLAAGFDWTLIRLNNDITILPNQPVLTYHQDNIDYSKNRFSSSYLRIPLSFDFRTNTDRKGKRAHFVIGPEGGFLLGGMVKQISSENGKQKFYNDYNFTRFRYGVVTRIGYGGFGIFAKYYMNDMFENSPAQAGLKNFSFGLMLGF